jgi:hypothetical protein
MNENAKRLIGKMRDKLRALELSLTRRDRAELRLLTDLSEVLGNLEIEILTAMENDERENLTQRSN